MRCNNEFEKGQKELHLEIILFFIVSIYCLLAPNRETCMDDTWISSIVGLSGSVKLFSGKIIFAGTIMVGNFMLHIVKACKSCLKGTWRKTANK